MKPISELLKSLISILFLIVFFSCSSTKKEENQISNITIERCEDCIYWSDFHTYELKLGSIPVYFKKYNYYKPLIIEWWVPSGASFRQDTNYSFYLRKNKKDSLNILVCYLTYTKNSDGRIVEEEIFKIFTQDTYLDNEGVLYSKKGEYKDLKHYFNRLTNNFPDSLKKRPKNYTEIVDDDVSRQDYFKNKEDLRSVSLPHDKRRPSEGFITMTINREYYDKDKAFNKEEKLYRLRDVAIYISYSSNIPYDIKNSDSLTLDNIRKYIDYEKESEDLDIPTFSFIYDSLLSTKTKHKMNIIRKNRGQPPFKVFLDSVEAYKRQFKKY